MTSQGHAHARFRRALLTKNVYLIDAAALELGRLALDDALRYITVLAEKRDPRFDRAAARFAARMAYEKRLTSAESHTVLALATALPSAPEAVSTSLRAWVETPRSRQPARRVYEGGQAPSASG